MEGRDFRLGGIKIEHPKGAIGHSDADVMIHAICDALLGAANLGDIGFHFPDTSQKYKNIDSKILLKEVVNLITDKNYEIENIDVTLCLQQPKIASYIPQMKKVLCLTMDISEGDLSCLSRLMSRHIVTSRSGSSRILSAKDSNTRFP